MKVQINDNFRLDTDAFNFILSKKRVISDGKRKGETDWDAVGFYPTLDKALNGFSRRFLLDSDAQTIDELKDAIRTTLDAIEEVKELAGNKI